MMNKKNCRYAFGSVGSRSFLDCLCCEPNTTRAVGKTFIFDTNLSDPRASLVRFCHTPDVGWTGPDEDSMKRGSL